MKYPIAILLISCLALSCSKTHEVANTEGFLDVPGGKIWYRVSGQGDATPILLLHGGPGYPSYYLNPLRALGNDRKVIVFDQLGCGRSTSITDTTLMTMDNHIKQVRGLMQALGIEKVHLYGHSWGSMLGIDYYLQYPETVESLILASPCLSTNVWEQDSDSLIAMLPEPTQEILRKNIQGIPQDSATLASAVGDYWVQFYARKSPTTPDFDSTVAGVGWPVYTHMWGSNDFFVVGTLRGYDRTADLASIKVPTLYMGGEFDPARPSTLRDYARNTPNASVAIIPGAGHVSMHDNPEDNISAIATFLKSVETK